MEKKQTAVDWLINQFLEVNVDSITNENMYIKIPTKAFKQAKEMEKEQRGYSEEDVIKIVEKSRETGLTAEYLLLTFKSE